MSSRPAARLTSDLLARKGSAQPAAREEDLYRPQRPPAAVVELGGGQAAGAGGRNDRDELARDPAPEASLREVPISRLTPTAPSNLPEPPTALDAQEEQPPSADETVEFSEFAEYTEVAEPVRDAADVAADIAEPSPDATIDATTDATIDAEAVEDDERAPEDVDASVDEPFVGAPEPADAVLPDVADSNADADVVVPPMPAYKPAHPPRPLTPSVLADIVESSGRGRERRPLRSALTVFGISAVAGVVLAAVWLAASSGLPDLRTMWQSAPPAGEATGAAPAPGSANKGETIPQSNAAAATDTAGDSAKATPADVAAAAVAETAKAGAATKPAAPVPELDVVRISEDGLPLLAGRATPLARLAILDNDTPIGTARADSNGEWVFQGETRLNPGRHAFSVAVGNAEADAATAGTSEPNAAATLTVPEPAAQPSAGDTTETTETESTTDATSARQSFDAATGVYYVVQLGSLPAEADAMRLWHEISQRYPSLTEGLEPVIQTAAQSGGGTIHRLRTGPFTSLQKARQLCSDFKKVGQDCLVVKRQNTDG